MPDEMAALHRALHLKRVVIVTPSVYGTDNAASAFGMKARGKDARGVAVIGPETSDRDMNGLARAGFRGIRLNMATVGVTDAALAQERFRAAVLRVKPLGWHVQMYAGPEVVAGVKNLVMESPVSVVFDHFGGMQAALGIDQPGFADLLEMLRSGKAYVKISGVYRASKAGPDYAAAAPLAKALIAANPDRVIWGSDWPHPDTTSGRNATDLSPLLPIDDGRSLNLLPTWAPDPAIRRKILTENPARLYAF